MSHPAIIVDKISKAYRIGLKEERFPTFRDALVRAVAAPVKRLRQLGSDLNLEVDSFWALRDVSFEVHPGEVVGIVGRNGAGKSTLLKILSRITEPTSGFCRLRGRVASLLEVGTGFHPELTGRENIYLNGAILGMKRAEISRKLDAIVEFSEIEKFLDTAVKFYSSGMAVRLAFAVAAHLEPEILIVDEVLAVGDAQFQKKCLGKMQEVSQGGGRTVLFVSHNMAAVTNLCQRCVLIQNGTLAGVGPSAKIVGQYLAASNKGAAERKYGSSGPGNDGCRLSSVTVLGRDDQINDQLSTSDPIRIVIEYCVSKLGLQPRISARLIASDGTIVFTVAADNAQHPTATGHYRSTCYFPGELLNEGEYTVSVTADVPFVKILFSEEQAVTVQLARTTDATGMLPERWPGVLRPKLRWNTELAMPLSPSLQENQ